MSKLKEENRVRRKRGTAPASVVWGVRADEAFWDRVSEEARREGISRNKIVVKALEQYLGMK